ncbi:MAG: hypothetical protein AMXMBFR33_42450 [Candidatus Xenobia bacterium]
MSTTVVRPTRMTTEAKAWLSSTVRRLRELLLKDLADELQSVYRLSLPLDRAGLSHDRHQRRRRLERLLDEQARAGTRGAKETLEEARKRHLEGAVKLAGATLVNRLVVLRQMEALGLVRVRAVTGGWSSPGYRELRDFAPALAADADEGYGFFLRLVFEELALDLPGLFGEVGLNALIGVPTATLRAVVEALEAEELSEGDRASLWGDDTVLGWVYQFWNDPEREALDEKIRTGGKIENHEIAAKTQLFTDRYMVEWLLQNSLGQLWMAICARHGWTSEVARNGTLERLEERRAEWRGKRERGEVTLEALMPLDTDEEERWKYWVPRELPSDAAGFAPASLRELKLLDPACGSGHFLVIAFSLLVPLYEEEARHRGERWTREQIAGWIVEQNLHGIDLDPRAVQIAAAAVWLKLKTCAPQAAPARLHLVASNLGLGTLPKNDPALLELEQAVERETGIPAALTGRVVESLKGADYLGSLLKVSEAVDRALEEHEKTVGFARSLPTQGELFRAAPARAQELTLEEARVSLVQLLEGFVARHTRGDDLGLRLRGEQLAAGVRFVRMLREGQYHLVVGNPPYQNAGKASDFGYLARHYPEARVDLYAAFLLRGLELSCPGGYSALLTLRGWMFLGQFEKLRRKLLEGFDLRLLGDLDRGGFELVLDELVAVVISLFWRHEPTSTACVGILPTPREDRSRDARRTPRKHSALLCGYERYEFVPERLAVVPGHPLIYWWDEAFLRRYANTPKLGDVARVGKGLCTCDDTRFLRLNWEIMAQDILMVQASQLLPKNHQTWAPYIRGATGRIWYEDLECVVRSSCSLLELKTLHEFRYSSYTKRIQNEPYYFVPGVAFSMIGSSFTARAHRYRSVFGNKGSSVFPGDIPQTLCLMNSATARQVLESLNPGIGFEVGDVNRLPLFPIESAEAIVARLEEAFTQHEEARETSVEFRRPGPSPWRTAQEWAQRAVDRPAGAPLPAYEPKLDPEPQVDHLSFALGVALGRFGAEGQGILEVAPAGALPHGILYLSAAGGPDSLEHPAAAPLLRAWQEHGALIAPRCADLREYLRTRHFPDDHLKRYEKRPIYFPLSSARRSFVAWCSIHRWSDHTLQVLLADFLQSESGRLKAELADLAQARATGDRASQTRAQARSNEVQALYEELLAFLRSVQEIAERGAPSPPRCPPREADARFAMSLDDGVMINAAALWPLLEPQWKKDPLTWWTELCTARGRKDYDWSKLARRYFPTRVEAKCRQDPSLAVAHGSFWKHHPEKACQWELRLQSPDELGPDFRLDEPGSDAARADFLARFPDKVRELREAEERRRARRGEQSQEDELDFGLEDEEEEE